MAETYKKRTREEVVAWLNRARQQKVEWEEKVQAMFAEEERQRKQAAKSHYYDISWT